MSRVHCPAHETTLEWIEPPSPRTDYGPRYHCPSCEADVIAGTLTPEERDERRLSAVSRYVADDPRPVARMIQYDAAIEQAGLDAVEEHK